MSGRIKKILLQSLIALIAFGSVTGHNRPWVTAYVGGWWFNRSDDGVMPISRIDFRGMTVCDHMSLIPEAAPPFIDTATVNDWVTNSMFLANCLKLTAAAHAAGVKCTYTIGAWASENAFLSATTPANLPRFIDSLVGFLRERGYDGIDIDWEPLKNSDVGQWKDFVLALRKALPSPRYLITATAGWGSPAAAYAGVQDYVDQINIMTYDFDTDASGYDSWYAASVYSDGVVDPFDHKTPVPSCEYMVNLFEKAGVRPSKLGIGCEPGGDLWKGITGARQTISTVTSWKADISYNTIKSKYYRPELYHWDNGAKASYLSYQAPRSSDDWFLSYDDPRALEAKLDYVTSAGLGGIIIYEIGMSYDTKSGKNPFLRVTEEFLRRHGER